MGERFRGEAFPNRENAAQAFVEENEAKIKQAITDVREGKEPLWNEVPVEEAVKRETNFATAVINKYTEWSQGDKEVVVLWDIDETIGRVNLEPGKEIFRPRPVIQMLMAHLKSSFPEIHNGTLTTRGVEAVQRQLEEDTFAYSLTWARDFFEDKYLMSTHGMPRTNTSVVEQQISQSLTPEQKTIRRLANPNSGTIEKYARMQQIKDAHPDKEFFIIDDLEVGHLAGLCVRDFVPNYTDCLVPKS